MKFESRRHHARGSVFAFFGRVARATEAYETAFRLDQRNVSAARNLGALAAKRKDFETAERWFQEAAHRAPAEASTWFNLGYVQSEQGKHREAVASHQEAVRRNPGLDRAWYGIGLSLAALGEHEQAAEAFTEVTKLQPMNGFGWYQLGMAYHMAGHGDRLEEVVSKLASFEQKTARLLVRHSGRSDLNRLLPELWRR
jgi:tetratricopeptide (TPR) repeat protein